MVAASTLELHVCDGFVGIVLSRKNLERHEQSGSITGLAKPQKGKVWRSWESNPVPRASNMEMLSTRSTR
jgi:hypothetical protein